MNLLSEPIQLKHSIEPKDALYLGAAIFLAIVLGFMLGSAILKR